MKHKNTKYKFNNKVLSQTCMKLQNFTTSSTQTLVCIILLNNYMHYIAQNQKKFYCMTTNKVSIIIYRIHIRYRLKKNSRNSFQDTFIILAVACNQLCTLQIVYFFIKIKDNLNLNLYKSYLRRSRNYLFIKLPKIIQIIIVSK